MIFSPVALRIFVHDLAASREFYESVMGWKLAAVDKGWLRYVTDTVDVVIELVHPGHPEDIGLVGRFTGVSVLSIDIHDDFEQLKSLGVSFTHAPSRRAWGGWLADFLDPCGNTLTLLQRAPHPPASVPDH